MSSSKTFGYLDEKNVAPAIELPDELPNPYLSRPKKIAGLDSVPSLSFMGSSFARDSYKFISFTRTQTSGSGHPGMSIWKQVGKSYITCNGANTSNRLNAATLRSGLSHGVMRNRGRGPAYIISQRYLAVVPGTRKLLSGHIKSYPKRYLFFLPCNKVHSFG